MLSQVVQLLLVPNFKSAGTHPHGRKITGAEQPTLPRRPESDGTWKCRLQTNGPGQEP